LLIDQSGLKVQSDQIKQHNIELFTKLADST